MCAKHGIWLDKGELKKILDSFAAQSLPAGSGSERQAGRWEGMFLGLFSLFLPK